MAQTQNQGGRYQPLAVNPPRLPYPAEAAQYDVDEGKWRALTDAVWPSAQSIDGVLLALSWCAWRKLDPIKKPCHIVPIWNSKLGRNVEGVWPSIAEVRITAFRTGQYAGIDEAEWGPMRKQQFKGRIRIFKDGNQSFENRVWPEDGQFEFPEWCRHTVWRIVAGEARKFVGPKVYFLAAYGAIQDSDLPNEKWQEPGWYMLEKCSEAAALRRAFPEEMGDMVTAEEMEGRRYQTAADLGDGVTVETPTKYADRPAQRPQRSEARFADKPVSDVDASGRVQQPQQGAQTAGQPASNAEARRQQPKQDKPPATAKKPVPPQQPQPGKEPPAAEDERPGEDLTGGADPDPLLVYDEVGEGTEVFTLKDYVEAVTKTIMAAQTEATLTALYDANGPTIDAQPETEKRAIFRVYSERMAAVRNAAKQQPAAQQQQPATEPPSTANKYALFDHIGKPYARELLATEFISSFDLLLGKAGDLARMEALWRYNSKIIESLTAEQQEAVMRVYDARYKNASGQGGLGV